MAHNIEEKTKHLPIVKSPALNDSVPYVEMAEIVLPIYRENSFPHTDLPQRRIVVYVAGRTELGIVSSTMVRHGDSCLLQPSVALYCGILDYTPLNKRKD